MFSRQKANSWSSEVQVEHIPRRKECWSQIKRLRRPIGLCLLSALYATAGCTTFSSSLNSICSSGVCSDLIEKHRNRTCALKAWYRREHNFCDQAYLRDFKNGFVAGYMAIADGKPGCPPKLPPKEYWGWAYQTAEGRAQMAAWFAGYPYGVQAAKDDGLGSWNHIQVDPEFLPHNRYGIDYGTGGNAGYNNPYQNYGGGQAYPYDAGTSTSPSGPSTPSPAPNAASGPSIMNTPGAGQTNGSAGTTQAPSAKSPFPLGE